jgi:hypothetical protein
VSDAHLEEDSERHRAAYEAGDKLALAQMIMICAVYHWPLPEWATTAFLYGYGRLVTEKRASWDDVLGNPFPKGMHARTAQLEEWTYEVYRRVKKLRAQGVPLDKAFSLVGRETALGGRTVISGLYYKVERAIREAGGEGLEGLWRRVGVSPTERQALLLGFQAQYFLRKRQARKSSGK